MRDLRQLFFTVLVLTFVGGLGTGAWVGTLTASAPADSISEDSRIEDFRRILDIDDMQALQLRRIFAGHQRGIASLERELRQEQGKRFDAIHEEVRRKIRQVLDDRQRELYDRLRKAQ